MAAELQRRRQDQLRRQEEETWKKKREAQICADIQQRVKCRKLKCICGAVIHAEKRRLRDPCGAVLWLGADQGVRREPYDWRKYGL